MIEIISDIQRIRNLCDKKRCEGKKIGLVPTMGALHEGHLSLVRRALESTDYVVVSIYVNPTQFGPSEDFNDYPRDIEVDIRLIENLGAHVVFTPDNSIMYPEGYATYVTVEGLTGGLCGRSRPVHFRGVATIVTKLFTIIRPHRAFFGQKDAQQLAVIRRMSYDLDMDIEIVGCPIVREKDGLAMSSRNKYLNNEERKQATVLYRSLKVAEKLVASGVTDSDIIVEKIRQILKESPLAKTEYVEIVDTSTMMPVGDISYGALCAISVWFHDTRLIDNVVFPDKNL